MLFNIGFKLFVVFDFYVSIVSKNGLVVFIFHKELVFDPFRIANYLLDEVSNELFVLLLIGQKSVILCEPPENFVVHYAYDGDWFSMAFHKLFINGNDYFVDVRLVIFVQSYLRIHKR